MTPVQAAIDQAQPMTSVDEQFHADDSGSTTVAWWAWVIVVLVCLGAGCGVGFCFGKWKYESSGHDSGYSAMTGM